MLATQPEDAGGIPSIHPEVSDPGVESCPPTFPGKWGKEASLHGPPWLMKRLGLGRRRRGSVSPAPGDSQGLRQPESPLNKDLPESGQLNEVPPLLPGLATPCLYFTISKPASFRKPSQTPPCLLLGSQHLIWWEAISNQKEGPMFPFPPYSQHPTSALYLESVPRSYY